MSFTVDKEGHKHYRMKMETGYLKNQGNDANATARKGFKPGEKLQFNYVHFLRFPMKRIKIQVPGFERFGLRRIIITEVKTGDVVFNGNGFTIFKMTRCSLPRSVTKRMAVGEKYKITIQE